MRRSTTFNERFRTTNAEQILFDKFPPFFVKLLTKNHSCCSLQRQLYLSQLLTSSVWSIATVGFRRNKLGSYRRTFEQGF